MYGFMGFANQLGILQAQFAGKVAHLVGNRPAIWWEMNSGVEIITTGKAVSSFFRGGIRAFFIGIPQFVKLFLLRDGDGQNQPYKTV